MGIAATLAAMTALAVPSVARAAELDGSPLNVSVDGIGGLQVHFDGSDSGEFCCSLDTPDGDGFQLRSAGGSAMRGEGSTATKDPVVSDSGNGTRSVTSEYDVTTLNSDHLPDVKVHVTETVSYTDGTRDVPVHLAIKNPGDAPVSFTAGELADLYVGGSDSGKGVFDPGPPRFVGGVSRYGGADGLLEVKGSEWTRYEEDEYDTVFDDFAAGDLKNTVLSDQDVDNEVGAEWAVTDLAPGATREIDLVWRFDARTVVTTTKDGDDGTCAATCTLRDALGYAPSGSTIVVPAGTYALDPKLGELTVADGRTLTVMGAGARPDGGTIIDAGGGSRVLHVLGGGTLNLSGVRLTGGLGAPGGGALAVDRDGAATITDSEIVDNAASQYGGGVGNYGTLRVIRSTIAGNQVTRGEGAPAGGGLFTADPGTATLVDTTVGDNKALDGGTGGGIAAYGPLTLQSTTIAGNQADAGGGGIDRSGAFMLDATDTIVAGNRPSACGGNTGGEFATSHDLADDASCPLSKDQGDLPGTDPLLGPLDDNGGPTDTYLPADTSPAVDAGDSSACSDVPDGVDQRGEERVQGSACDIGSVEQAAPERQFDPPVISSPHTGDTVGATITFRGTAMPGLYVDVWSDEGYGATGVRVDDNGDWTAQVPVNESGTYAFYAWTYLPEVGGSPPSDPVTLHVQVDAPATPQISAAPAVSGSTVTLTGTAGPNDAISILEGQTEVGSTTADGNGQWTASIQNVSPGSHTYTAVARNAAGSSSPSDPRTVTVASTPAATPTPPPAATPTPTPTPTATPVPPPVVGKKVNVAPRGTVKIKVPGSNAFVELAAGAQIPTGTVVDTTHGRITLTTAVGGGKTQHADFYKGIFKVTQTHGRHPLTQLALAGPKPTCTTKGKRKTAHASAARKRKHKKKVKHRSLWGSGHGSFRTKGQYSSATVRGTTWLTQDSCAGTLTRVTHGVVQVRDFRRHKKLLVRAGHRYLARARRH